LGPQISRDLKIGTYVVEADRAKTWELSLEELPLTTQLSAAGACQFPQPRRNHLAAWHSWRRCRLEAESSVLLRMMKFRYFMKREEEDELLKICRGRLASGLPMTVVDAEYQFDRHKLTLLSRPKVASTSRTRPRLVQHVQDPNLMQH
jgi:hypothetical protein